MPTAVLSTVQLRLLMRQNFYSPIFVGWWNTWNIGSTDPSWSEIADFKPIFLRSASAVTSSEKSSINTNRNSTTRFPMSLRWSSYVDPKPSKGGWKPQNGRFRCKIAHRLKKVCYKVSLCENYQRQSCKTFIGLTIRAKMIGAGRPLLSEILDKTDCVGAKWPIFACSASAVTPSKKSAINTNRKSTTRFPMSQR